MAYVPEQDEQEDQGGNVLSSRAGGAKGPTQAPKRRRRRRPAPKAQAKMPQEALAKARNDGAYSRFRRGEQGQSPVSDISERYMIKKMESTGGRPDEYVPSFMNPKFQAYLAEQGLTPEGPGNQRQQLMDQINAGATTPASPQYQPLVGPDLPSGIQGGNRIGNHMNIEQLLDLIKFIQDIEKTPQYGPFFPPYPPSQDPNFV